MQPSTAAAEVWLERPSHGFTGSAPTVNAHVYNPAATPAFSFSHSRYLLSAVLDFTISFPPPSRKADLSPFPPVAEKGRFPSYEQLPFARQPHHEQAGEEGGTDR